MIQEIYYEVAKRNQIISPTCGTELNLVGTGEDKVTSKSCYFMLIDVKLVIQLLILYEILGCKSEVDQMERTVTENVLLLTLAITIIN